MTKYIVDTHIVIWFLLDSPRLSLNTKNIFKSNKKIIFYIPSIVLAEITTILEKGKVKGNLKLLIDTIKADSRFIIVPFDEVIFEKFRLENKNLEIHDRIIMATARLFDAFLLSKDKEIKKYYQKTVW